MIDLVTIKIDSEDLGKVEVELNDSLFNSLGITLDQVSDKIDKDILNKFVMNIYTAMKTSMSEAK